MQQFQIARGNLEKFLEEKMELKPGEFFLDYEKNELYIGGEGGKPMLVSKLTPIEENKE